MMALIGSERARRPFYGDWAKTTGGSLLREDATKARLPAPLGGRGPQNLHFYQTKPIVILANISLTYVNATGCVDYKKMTNGFVFGRETPL